MMQMLSDYQKNIASRVFDGLTILETNILMNIKSRSGLHVRSGSLLNSVSASKKVTIDGSGNIVGEIGPEGIPYAAIHEFGGTTKAHDILPRNGKVLAFMMNGNPAFAKVVHHPGSKIPARPYLEPAILQSRDEILKEFGLFLMMTFKPRSSGGSD